MTQSSQSPDLYRALTPDGPDSNEKPLLEFAAGSEEMDELEKLAKKYCPVKIKVTHNTTQTTDSGGTNETINGSTTSSDTMPSHAMP